MQLGRGTRWGHCSWRPALSLALSSALGVTGVGLTSVTAAAASTERSVAVIVQELPGAGDRPEGAVVAAGGLVRRQLSVIDGFAASVPAGAVTGLRASAGVRAVTEDAAVRLSGGFDGYAPKQDPTSMYWVAQEVTGAAEYWDAGFRGQGVGVALIDSGVAPVNGLTTAGKVLHGPDLSFDSQHDAFRDVDTYGHGTHLAGIIAGRDDAAPEAVQKGVEDHFVGMAPSARVISLKVADSHGNTDVSQVLAAIDWVVQHRNDPGMNIRVLNLSFGTDATQDYRTDPLTHAVEAAWKAGIVVVVAGGNQGDGSAQLNNPAYDPRILAVGGADGRGTYGVADDVIGTFSSHGDAARAPDLVAPGKSVVSLVSPGSRADVDNAAGRVGTRQLRGTGTSQAAAVVSGAAALVISQRPGITPDQVKKLLVSTAQRLPAADVKAQGAGMVDLKAARGQVTPSVLAATQAYAPSTGLGSLDASRGSGRLSAEGVELAGEQDIFGAPFSAAGAAAASAAGTAWAGGSWNGNRWSGDGWSGNRWSSEVWSGNRWSGNRWSGEGWLGNRWSGAGWSGNRWSSGGWS